MRALSLIAGLFALISTSAMAMPVPLKHGKVVITIDVSSQRIWVDKYTGKRAVRIEGITLPIVKESIHAGRCHPTKTYNRFPTVNGITYLENVLFFDGGHNIRTTHLFPALLKAGHPVSGQVVLEPDFGKILYDTVSAYGVKQTEIRIRK